jgi:FkbM family methyltransferase
MGIFKREISISLRSEPKGQIQLGELAEFHISLKDQKAEYRAYLVYQQVFYPEPLGDWTSESKLNYYPEAPGNYCLAIEWRSPGGKRGWKEANFRVVIDHEDISTRIGPQWVEIDRQTRVLTGSGWESSQVVGHERSVTDWLVKKVKPGWVIYDIGSNIGQYALLFSRLVGERGQVYCLEANPISVNYLRLGLEASGRKNVRVFPVAVTGGSDSTRLRINYGNLSTAVTGDSYLYSNKVGHEIHAPGISLDDLVNRYVLKPADLIKIDIEGAEAESIFGMMQVIQSNRPVVVLEAHGVYAAEQCVRQLDNAGYRYLHLKSGKEFVSAEEVLEWFPGSVQSFVCESK